MAKRKKKLFKNSEKVVVKPKVKIKGYSVRNVIKRGKDQSKLVTEGRTGYFNEEMMEETKWLS